MSNPINMSKNNKFPVRSDEPDGKYDINYKPTKKTELTRAERVRLKRSGKRIIKDIHPDVYIEKGDTIKEFVFN